MVNGATKPGWLRCDGVMDATLSKMSAGSARLAT
jgi:hypothetical protein